MSRLARRVALRWRLALGCIVAAGCAELPLLPANSCGNGVHEPEANEDCDTFSPYPGVRCRRPGETNACRLDCSVDAQGERAACPSGWGCDEGSVCRAPTGKFGVGQSHLVGPVGSLLAGDFDGDGRSELITRKPTDRLDRGQLAFHYFDARGALVESRDFPKFVLSPTLAQLTEDDARADLLFSDFRIGLLLGRTDRSLVPETFSSYRVPDTVVRIVGTYDGFVSSTSNLVVFGNFGGRPGFSVPDPQAQGLRSLGELPQPMEAGTTLATGDLFEGPLSPCDEIVVAAPGATSLLLLDVCSPIDAEGKVVWRETALQTELPLTPEAPIDGPTLVADINADQHLDLLFSAGARAYVAYGDGARLTAAMPYTLEYWDNGKLLQERALPLAAGDFTSDGWADFAFPDRFVVSFPRPATSTPRYEVGFGNLGAPWTVARIADINGNGHNDVIAASSAAPGISVHSGTGASYLWPTTLPTQQPVEFLSVTDIDSDLTNDIAFVEAPAADEARASLSIAFGNVGRPPSPPLPVARLTRPEQLASYRLAARGNLVVASSLEEPTPAGAITLLDGTTDRIPFAPYALVSFSNDGDLRDYPAQHVLSGKFRGPGHHDVMALDSETDTAVDPPRQIYQLWFLADLAQGESTPVRLRNGVLDESLEPTAGAVGTERLQIASCAADLDGDGRDEAVWAMPTDDGGCAISLFHVEDEGELTLVPHDAVLLDQPCGRPQLASIDANGDGALDLLLLTGSAGDETRTLELLWNDRSGGFSPARSERVNEAGESPQAFTTLPATTLRAASIVYVSRRAALSTQWSEAGGAFEAAQTLASLEQGSGAAAGDVNGDGATDLAIADGNRVLLLLAELAAR